jgi:transcriptional regulator with XRE-family HTH domain
MTDEIMSEHLYSLRRVIARNCLYLRKRARITQTDLAQLIGLSQSSINYVESGLGNPSIEILAKIAKGLEAEMTDFFVKSIWQMDHYNKEAFSVIQGAGFELKKLAMQLPEGWDFQQLTLKADGEIQIPAKARLSRQFYFCTQGSLYISGSEEQVLLQQEEGACISGAHSLQIKNRRSQESIALHLCYHEKKIY